MKILGMGMPELLIILAVILLIFGPKNLPKLGSALGQTVKGLREGMGGDKKNVEAAEDSDDEAVLAEEPDAKEEEAAGSRTKVAKVVKKKAPATETVS